MKRYDPLYIDLSNLMTLLYAVNALGLVEDEYEKFGNTAPAELLKEYMQKLEARLAQAKL